MTHRCVDASGHAARMADVTRVPVVMTRSYRTCPTPHPSSQRTVAAQDSRPPRAQYLIDRRRRCQSVFSSWAQCSYPVYLRILRLSLDASQTMASKTASDDDSWSAKDLNLVQHHRVPGRTGGTDDPQRRPDKRPFEDFLVDERFRVDILKIPDAPTRLHLGVARHGEVRTLLARGLCVARRRIAHRERNVSRRQVFAGAYPEARFALAEKVARRLPLISTHGLVAIVAPTVALPSVQSHAVARADLLEALHLKDAPDVVSRHNPGLAGLVGDRQHLSAGRDQALGLLVRDGVQHHEAADEAQFTRVLHPERPHPEHPATGAVLVCIPRVHAVVHHRPFRRVHPDVAGAVKLRLNLADLGGDKLVVVDEGVLAEGATGRRSGNAHLPAARPERRRLTVVVLADRDGFVLLDGG